MKKMIFVILAFVVVLSSCSMGGTDGEPNVYTEPKVYVGGSYLDNGVKKACYWVDGIRCELDGEDVELITASGGKVYTAGHYREGETLKACYWINNARYDLFGCTQIGNEITVDRGNVYILGMIGEKLYYWINEARHDLPAGDIFITSLYATKGSLYMSGYYLAGTTPKPCYWVNGIRYNLPISVPNEAERYISKLIVKNNKTYILGSFNSHNFIYWINGIRQKGFYAQPNGFAVDNGNVYIAAGEELYKNGDFIGIYESYIEKPIEGRNTLNRLTVSREKVYVVGFTEGHWDNGVYTYTACYWVDGVRHELSSGTGGLSIFVEE